MKEACTETYRLIEDCREHKQEDDIKEIDCRNGDIEGVGLLVHPRSKNANSNEEASLDDDQSNGLSCAAALSKGDEQGLDKDVREKWHDEVVCCGAELDV